MIEDENIEHLFQDTFDGFEVTPPASVKSAIDRQLGLKRSPFAWWLGGLAVLGIVTVLFYLSTENTVSNSDQLALNDTANNDISGVKSNANSSTNMTVTTKLESEINQTQSTEGKSNASTIKVNSSKGETNSSSRITNASESKVSTSKSNVNASKSKINGSTIPEVSESHTATTSNGKTKTSFTKKGTSKSKTSTSIGKTNLSKLTSKSAVKNSAGDASTEISTTTENASVSKKGGDEPNGNNKNDNLVTSDSSLPEAQKSDSTLSEVPMPIDSISSANTSADSSHVVPTSTAVLPETPKSTNWMLAASFGPTWSNSFSKSDLTVKSNTGITAGIGLYRKLDFGPLAFAGLDAGYFAQNETYGYSSTTTTIDSTNILSIDSVPVYAQPGDSLPLYYDYTYNYGSTSNTQSYSTTSRISGFSFGLTAVFQFKLTDAFGLTVSPGFNYGLSTYQFSDSVGKVKLSSTQFKLGLSVYYDWNSFRFSFGLDSRYNMLKSNDVLYLQQRKRMYFTPQVGIAWKF